MNNRYQNRNNHENNGASNSWLWGAAAAVAGVAAVGGGLWLASRSSSDTEQPTQTTEERRRVGTTVSSEPLHRRVSSSSSDSTGCNNSNTSGVSSVLSSIMERVLQQTKVGVPRSSIPENPVLNNLNALLDDIYVRFVALKSEDFELYYGVFCDVFAQLQEKMKEVDPYYSKYSSRKQFAGSHFDGLRIKKPDEFDMDIVVDLPLNFREDELNPAASDIVLEPQSPGYLQMRMGAQFGRLPHRDGADWLVNKTAYEWKDDRDYLLRSKFTYWFKSVVMRALNRFEGRVVWVRGTPYRMRTSESGPAVTLYVENQLREFRLDVDLVPAIRFPQNRLPAWRGYRSVPPRYARPDFMVVPKPNKSAANGHEEGRGWRLALHDQEKQILYNLNNLKPTLRLMKKLRDAQCMHALSSYYIKTLFLHEVVARDEPGFWNRGRDQLFLVMVRRLHEAVVRARIPYFWHHDHNLLAGVGAPVLAQYARTLHALLQVLEQPQQYKSVARYLLTKDEFEPYNTRYLHL